MSLKETGIIYSNICEHGYAYSMWILMSWWMIGSEMPTTHTFYYIHIYHNTIVTPSWNFWIFEKLIWFWLWGTSPYQNRFLSGAASYFQKESVHRCSHNKHAASCKFPYTWECIQNVFSFGNIMAKWYHTNWDKKKFNSHQEVQNPEMICSRYLSWESKLSLKPVSQVYSSN